MQQNIKLGWALNNVLKRSWKQGWESAENSTSRRHREQLQAYRLEEGIFGRNSSIRDRIKIHPGRWWEFYGAE